MVKPPPLKPGAVFFFRKDVDVIQILFQLEGTMKNRLENILWLALDNWVETTICILVLGLLAIIADGLTVERSETFPASVISRQYIPASVSTGVGTTSGGNTAVVVSSEPEKWFYVVELYGEILAVETESAKWASFEEGDLVEVYHLTGSIFGINWGWRL